MRIQSGRKTTKTFLRWSYSKYLVKVLLSLCTVLIMVSPCFSVNDTPASRQPQTPEAPSTSKPVSPSPELTVILSIITGVLGAGVGGIGLATAIVNYRTTQIKLEAEEKLKAGLFSAEETSTDEKRNSIIVAGIGGSGKTTLIKEIFDNNASPRITTDRYKLYSISEKKENIQYNYYVADCAGQNMGTLISGLMLEQKEQNSPMTYGAINSIIIVVDIAKTPKVFQSLTSQEVADNFAYRVEQHLMEWSSTALDLIFGLTKPGENGLKYVCLFINKIDLLQGSAEEIKEKVISAYQPLIDKLSSMSRGVFFRCLIGSIEQEIGLMGLKKDLKEYSSPGTATISNLKI